MMRLGTEWVGVKVDQWPEVVHLTGEAVLEK